MDQFVSIIDWLYSVSAVFGVDHIVVRNKVYWFDSKEDWDSLYLLYTNDTK